MRHRNRLVRRAIAHAFELAMHPAWDRDAAAHELSRASHGDILRLARARIGLELAARPGPLGHRAYDTIDAALYTMPATATALATTSAVS